MRPYQNRRLRESPDVGDIQEEGRKSSVGRIKEKGGDFKPYSRPAKKKKTRRYLKRSDKMKGWDEE